MRLCENVDLLVEALFSFTHTHTHTHTHTQKSSAATFVEQIFRAAVVIEWVDVKQFTHTITINTKDTCATAIYPAHPVPSFGCEARLIRLFCVCVCVCVCVSVHVCSREKEGAKRQEAV